jgi:DNA-binding Lrp family transcriptional regulator
MERKCKYMEVQTEMTGTLGKYYGNKIVTALIGIETDVNLVETIGRELAKENNVEDVLIVTGQFDIVLKVRFPDYEEFQRFIVNRLSRMSGIKGSKTMMVLSIKKEMGKNLGA